ncbi:hypothetical protein HGB13_01060 [bacterium]|nr:hypothetical protein [bacterium]
MKKLLFTFILLALLIPFGVKAVAGSDFSMNTNGNSITGKVDGSNTTFTYSAGSSGNGYITYISGDKTIDGNTYRFYLSFPYPTATGVSVLNVELGKQLKHSAGYASQEYAMTGLFIPAGTTLPTEPTGAATTPINTPDPAGSGSTSGEAGPDEMNGLIKFFLKIALVIAAAMVPITLGDKLASAISNKIGNATRGIKDNAYKTSRLGSTMAGRAKAAEKRAMIGAYERMGRGGLRGRFARSDLGQRMMQSDNYIGRRMANAHQERLDMVAQAAKGIDTSLVPKNTQLAYLNRFSRNPERAMTDARAVAYGRSLAAAGLVNDDHVQQHIGAEGVVAYMATRGDSEIAPKLKGNNTNAWTNPLAWRTPEGRGMAGGMIRSMMRSDAEGFGKLERGAMRETLAGLNDLSANGHADANLGTQIDAIDDHHFVNALYESNGKFYAGLTASGTHFVAGADGRVATDPSGAPIQRVTSVRDELTDYALQRRAAAATLPATEAARANAHADKAERLVGFINAAEAHRATYQGDAGRLLSAKEQTLREVQQLRDQQVGGGPGAGPAVPTR